MQRNKEDGVIRYDDMTSRRHDDKQIMAKRVIGIGETVLDILFKNDQPQKAVPGGSTFNSIVSLGRAGVPCIMVTEVGDDHVGDITCAFLRKNGVSDEFVCRHKGTKSHITLAFLNEHNDAQYTFYKDHASAALDGKLPEISKEDVVFFLDLSTRVNGLVLAEFPGYFYTRREGSAVMRKRSDDDSVNFAKHIVAFGNKHNTDVIWRSISSTLGYDFIQWADERDPAVTYDPDSCELRSIWKELESSGRLDLSVMHWWWRIAIKHWLKTGDLQLAHKIRRIREWLDRLI